MLKIPPESDIKNAVAPLVKSTKAALIKVTAIAGKKPIEEATNIVAIFENPAFAPGGIKAAVGIKLSKNESVIATADKIPKTAIL